jgi:hypothetical protein
MMNLLRKVIPFAIGSGRKGFLVILAGFLLVFTGGIALGQAAQPQPIRVVVKPSNAFATDHFFINKNRIIDSLTTSLLRTEQTRDSLMQILRADKSQIRKLEGENAKVTDENNSLKKNLDGALGDKLQSSHTSSILFIFNVIIAVILLVAIAWMFLRKKEEKRTSVNSREGISEVFDNKFDRIEKLGSLRDKGLLTEEEFNFQKKQLLGERN